MIVKAAMVHYLLLQRGFGVSLSGNPDAAVERIRLAPRGKIPDGTLAVSETAPKRAPKSTCACISFDGRQGEDVLKLFEAVNDCVLALHVWDGEIKDALAKAAPLETFIGLAEQMVPYPFGFYDTNAHVLGASSNFTEMASKFAAYDDELSHLALGEMPANLMIDLFEDEDYLAAPAHKGLFYYRTTAKDNEPWSGLCANVFVGGAYAARLVMQAPNPKERVHHGAELLMERFGESLQERLEMAASSASGSHEGNDPVHELFRGIVFKGRPAEGGLERALAGYGWVRRDPFTMVKFLFFETVKWESAAPFICGQLERQWGCSVAIHAERSIVWVLNRAHSSWKDDASLRAAVAETARTYACRAGVSCVFDDFAQLGTCHKSCEAALAIGRARNPHYWYFNFEDYALDYALSKVTDELPASAVASKKVAKLKQVDESEGTEYVATLRCYIDNKFSATRTAEALFMHRTSFLRKLERIERVSGIGFDDPDEVLYVALSLRLI